MGDNVSTEDMKTELRCRLHKSAVVLQRELTETLPEGYMSRLGRVDWQLSDDPRTIDAEGKCLVPPASRAVSDLSTVLKALCGIARIRVFAPEDVWDFCEEKGVMFCGCPALVRLVLRNYVAADSNTCIFSPTTCSADKRAYEDARGVDVFKICGHHSYRWNILDCPLEYSFAIQISSLNIQKWSRCYFDYNPKLELEGTPVSVAVVGSLWSE